MLSMATVLANETMGAPEEGLRRLVLWGIGAARPGQFLHIQVSAHLEPLLRRPLSIARIDQERAEVTLFYRVQGRGTQVLVGVQPGEHLSVLGPLGQGFSLPAQLSQRLQLSHQSDRPNAGHQGHTNQQGEVSQASVQAGGELWLVAGGIGVFPLLALAQEAIGQGIPVRLFWGGTHKQFLESAGLSYWEALGIPLHLTTLDGSFGRQGMVTDELDTQLSLRSFSSLPPVLEVATCGPRGMMRAVVERCLPQDIPVEVSLEERMGCGVGACLGCSVTVRSDNKSLRNKKVCQDGPVFRGEEVVWDA